MKKVKAKMTLEKLAEEMREGFKRADNNLEKLAMSVAKGFASVDERFDKVDERFERVDKRFDKVDATMEHNRLELSSRLTSVEKRVAVLEDR